MLSLCHDCVIEERPDGVNYQGESPDEIALVKTASQVGFMYCGRNQLYKKVRILGEHTDIEELIFFPFNSDRKRASIIVRHEGKIKIMIKGADSYIIDRLAPLSLGPQPYLEGVKKKLEIFSRKGLRTLCMAERILSESEWDQIEKELDQINEAADPGKALFDLAEKIEVNLTLIGCSAVEDRLQDQVPETIRDFIKAEIKVWMLTGDKLETAENIGYSCKLIQEDFKKLYITGEDNLASKYQECIKAIQEFDRLGHRRTILIEGSALTKLWIKEDLKHLMINNVMTKCNSVICCRVSPK